jgi:diguanylate cyclase (GGDEF)-like protein
MSATGYTTTARLQAQRFDIVLHYGAWVALGVHLLFILFFFAVGARGMTLFNVGSVALYLACVVFGRRLRPSLVFATAAVATVAHAWLAVATIGWASGFHYHVFVLALITFFNPRWSLPAKLGFLALVCLAYVGLGRWSTGQRPGVIVDAEVLTLVNDINIALLFGFLAYFAHLYAKVAHAAEDKLQRLAATDALTGLHNRRVIEDVAEHEWARHRELNQPLSLVMVDADDFKALNDKFGHDCGDHVLRIIAKRLRLSVRSRDYLGRWGGEEFVLLLPKTDCAVAEEVAERVREAARAPVTLQGQQVTVTLTVGVSTFRPDDNFASCLARADRALLEGKRAGKNRVMVA